MLTFFHLRRRSASLSPAPSPPSSGTGKDIRVVSEVLMTPLISAILGVGEDTTDAADAEEEENELDSAPFRRPDVRVRVTQESVREGNNVYANTHRGIY